MFFFLFFFTLNDSSNFHRCCWQDTENMEATMLWKCFRNRWLSEGKRLSVFLSVCLYLAIYRSIYWSICCVFSVGEACDGWEERTAEGTTTSIPGGAPLLIPDAKHALLCPGLRKWRRGIKNMSLWTVGCTVNLTNLYKDNKRVSCIFLEL